MREGQANRIIELLEPKPNEKHDFNWAKARCDVTVEHEFEKLKEAVRQAVEAVQADRPVWVRNNGKNFRFRDEAPDDKSFAVSVTLDRGTTGTIHFSPTGDGKSIKVIRSSSTSVTLLKPFLNHFGELRYGTKDDERSTEGEYLRWQVVRKMLEGLFSL